MFFKKKKTMNEQDVKQPTDTNTDNANLTEDQLAEALNTDDSVGGMQHLDDAVEEESETEKLRAELEEAKDKYIRLVAEFDNFRRRNAKERVELTQTAGKEIIQSLLVVLDDTDRAAKQLDSSDDINLIREGVGLVFNKFRTIMQQKGLKKMVSVHQDFDADLHEAITEIPAPTEELKGKVIDEIEPGYYLNDKLIRYAKVVVGK